MAKLTNDLRQRLETELLRHAFLGQLRELVEARRRFARRVFNDVIPPGMQTALDELPEGWVPTVTSFKVQFGGGGGVSELALNGWLWLNKVSQLMPSEQRPEEVRRRVPSKYVGGVIKVYEPTHHLSDEHAGLAGRGLDLEKAVRATQDQITRMLRRVTTTGALLKGWPETEPFLTRLMGSGTPVAVPALPVLTLNKMLDLPVAEEAEA